MEILYSFCRTKTDMHFHMTLSNATDVIHMIHNNTLKQNKPLRNVKRIFLARASAVKWKRLFLHLYTCLYKPPSKCSSQRAGQSPTRAAGKTAGRSGVEAGVGITPFPLIKAAGSGDAR